LIEKSLKSIHIRFIKKNVQVVLDSFFSTPTCTIESLFTNGYFVHIGYQIFSLQRLRRREERENQKQ